MFLKQRGREVVRAQLRQPVPAAPSPEPVAARFQATSTNDRHERAAQGREEMNSLRAAKRDHFPVFRMWNRDGRPARNPRHRNAPAALPSGAAAGAGAGHWFTLKVALPPEVSPVSR